MKQLVPSVNNNMLCPRQSFFIVCSSGAIYSGSLAPYDDELIAGNIIGSPFNALSQYAAAVLRRKYANDGVDIPAYFSNAGVYTFTNTVVAQGLKPGQIKVGGYLFFVYFNICETNDDCQLWLNEEGSVLTRTIVSRGKATVPKPVPDPDNNVNETNNPDVTKAKRLNPVGQCDTMLIYVDMPSGDAFFILPPNTLSTFTNAVKQKIQIIEGSTGDVKDTFEHAVTIGFSVQQAVISSP